MLERLVYVSTAASRQDLPGQAARIADEVATFNRDTGVGGVIVGHDGHFVQALEGERPVLDDLLKRLEGDSRHYDMVLVDRWRIEERLFAGWAMAGVATDAAIRAGLDALIADPTLCPRSLVETLRGRAVPLAGPDAHAPSRGPH